MDNIMKYKEYWAEIKYSDEDKCFCGKVEGLKKDTILFEGNSVKELKEDFENAIDSYLELCKKRTQTQFKLRSVCVHTKSFNIRHITRMHFNRTHIREDCCRVLL